jgi:serine/threonine protein kinase
MDKKSKKKEANYRNDGGYQPKNNKKIIETNADDVDFSSIEEEVGHKYQITNQIGAGSYGNVYEAIERETGKKVAIKSIHSIFDDLVD